MRLTAREARELLKHPKKRTTKPQPRQESNLEAAYATKLKQRGLPEPVREYRAIPGRRFRVDFAFVEQKLAVELEGGVWTGGRHTTGVGFTNDCLKYALLVLEGWRVLRFTASQVEDDTAVDFTERALRG